MEQNNNGLNQDEILLIKMIIVIKLEQNNNGLNQDKSIFLLLVIYLIHTKHFILLLANKVDNDQKN